MHLNYVSGMVARKVPSGSRGQRSQGQLKQRSRSHGV